MARIGVFVCMCGTNISDCVDVNKVAEEASKIRGVAYATNYRYMCSSPGQNLIKEAIEKYSLDGIVVAACSPRMHEVTFRSTAESKGLNPYVVEMANIREHCSWVHEDKGKATEKAIDIVKMLIAKVRRNAPLKQISVSIKKKALVIGGGIAGIQSALDISDGKMDVILVERTPSIGGKMAQLDETFPTLDCSACILTPKMVEVTRRQNIKLYTYAEVEEVSGYIGNFTVKIRKKAKSVIDSKCVSCGKCYEKCPASKITSEFNAETGNRTAIYVPFPQAVPNIPVLDRKECRWFKENKCGVCKKICPADAIDYEQQDEIITEEVGAIVVATGYDLFPQEIITEFGAGRYKDVITGLQFERLISSSGPTGGEIRRPSDGKVPETVVFVQCVGSRDEKYGKIYCSKICCMYTAKHTMLLKHKVPNSRSYVFYIDIRAGGKGYEEFVRRAADEGAIYLRGRVSKIFKKGDKLIVLGSDTLTQRKVEIEADMVVLATGVVPQKDYKNVAEKLKIGYDIDGFFNEAHPKLRPVETNTAGIFLAGACQAPKDIPDSVNQGSSAASKVLGLFSNETLIRDPQVAEVNPQLCIGCFLCKKVCPYNAPEESEYEYRVGGEKKKKRVSRINEGLCQGCGACVSTCWSKAVMLKGYTDEQIYSEIMAIVNG